MILSLLLTASAVLLVGVNSGLSFPDMLPGKRTLLPYEHVDLKEDEDNDTPKTMIFRKRTLLDPCEEVVANLERAGSIASQGLDMVGHIYTDIGSNLDSMTSCSGFTAPMCFGGSALDLKNKIESYKPVVRRYVNRLTSLISLIETDVVLCFGLTP